MGSRTGISLLIYIIRRLLMLLPTLIGIMLIIFTLVQMLPVTKRAMLFVQDVRELRAIPDIIKEYGLDQPVYIQFAIWMGQVFRGNLGWSETAYGPVLSALLWRLPATLEIVLYSIPIILFLGIFLGVISAKHKGRPLDHAPRTMANIGWALPSFWFGILLLGIFYYGLGWFAPFRYGTEVDLYITAPNSPWRTYTGFMTIDSLLNGQTWIFTDVLRHLVLPVTIMAISNIPIIMKLIHSSTLETLKGKSIALANVNSLTQEVTWKHMLVNALFSTFTFLGLLLVSMLTTLIVAETVFKFPGIGKFVATAAWRLDIASVIGFLLLSSFFFVIVNLVVDIVYGCVDARIK